MIAGLPVSSPRLGLTADIARSARLISWLRWLMLLLGSCVALACWWQHVYLPWPLLIQALLTLAALNAALPWWLRRGGDPLLALRIGLGADVLVLTELLAFTGGAANPLASLFLPPVLFAALLSPGLFAWALALASVVAYGLLFEWHLSWPVDHVNALHIFSMHLTGMWLSFALSALLIAGFVSWLAQQLALREAALAAARETQLRDEQLLAVGMQAAGAAHSLSTPLNTMTLLVDELLATRQPDVELMADLRLMKAQLANCGNALARLKLGSESAPGESALFAALTERLAGWRSLRPDVRLDWRAPQGPDPLVALDPAFWPAFFNLINNAAEAGGGELMVAARLEEGVLLLDISNSQGCLTEEQLERAGLTPLPSSKPVGMGLGVMLSHATLARLGGSLRLLNRPEGGVHAQVRLPLLVDDKDGA